MERKQAYEMYWTHTSLKNWAREVSKFLALKWRPN